MTLDEWELMWDRRLKYGETASSPQTYLLQICMWLEPGSCYDVPHRLIAEAAVSDFGMFDRMSGARPEDIRKFIEKVDVNWHCRFLERDFGRRWTIYKPKIEKRSRDFFSPLKQNGPGVVSEAVYQSPG